VLKGIFARFYQPNLLRRRKEPERDFTAQPRLPLAFQAQLTAGNARQSGRIVYGCKAGRKRAGFPG
jgi:hypothetical protein